jgi:hypothetical protein
MCLALRKRVVFKEIPHAKEPFTAAIIGSCVIIGLLVGYEQTARSLEKISHSMAQ